MYTIPRDPMTALPTEISTERKRSTTKTTNRSATWQVILMLVFHARKYGQILFCSGKDTGSVVDVWALLMIFTE